MGKIKRTATRAEGGVTEKEKEQFAELVKEYTKVAFRTEPINKEKITDAIYRLYEVAGLKRPRVVIVPSPFVGRLSAGVASSIWYLRKKCKNAATRAATDAATDAATYAATVAATDAATYVATVAATRAATDAATYVAIEENWLYDLIKKFTPNEIRFTFGCIEHSWRMYQGGNMWSSWLAYSAAMRDVLGLKGLPVWDKYQAWEDAGREGGFRYMHEEFCIVSDFPAILKVNERNQPHSSNGPSHRWRDGFEIYHLNGVRFDKELYWKIVRNEMSGAEILAIPDIDQRTQALRFMPITELISELKGEMIDEVQKMAVDGTIITWKLYRFPSGEVFSTDAYYCLMDCPSTGKQHFEGVEVSKTVADAMSWAESNEFVTITPDEWLRRVPLQHEN